MLKKSRNYILWLIATSFMFYQFIIRLFPGLIVKDLMKHFSVNATEMGIFFSLYYIGYSIMQIPMAYLLDKYGPKLIISASAALCGAVSVLLITTDNWYVALISRFLIGCFSTAGILGTSKVISMFFPNEKYGQMLGFTVSVGLLGAVYGGMPVSKLIGSLGWKDVGYVLGLCSIGIGIITVALFPRYKKFAAENATANPEGAVLSTFKNVNLWLLGIASLLLVGTLEGFADAWGISYLKNYNDWTQDTSSGVISFIYIGMIIGSPVLMKIADMYKSHYGISIISGVITTLILGLFLTCKPSQEMAIALMGILGVCCNYQIVMLVIAKDLAVSRDYLTISIAFLNGINMLGGSFFHGIIGKSMDMMWDGTLDAVGNRIYSIANYQAALATVPICAVLGTILILIVKMRASNRSHS